MKGQYIDFGLIKEYPNKYKLTPKSIKKLKILDWGKLKKKTWHNNAMSSGNWWCHLDGCQKDSQQYNDEDEFWIGFNEDNNKIDCSFSCQGGMCHYLFEKFYDAKEIENKFDMMVQVNAIKWLNEMIDDEILGVEK